MGIKPFINEGEEETPEEITEEKTEGTAE